MCWSNDEIHRITQNLYALLLHTILGTNSVRGVNKRHFLCIISICKQSQFTCVTLLETKRNKFHGQKRIYLKIH